MSRWSIKSKMTLWYAAMVTIIAVLAFAALAVGTNSLQLRAMERELSRAVAFAAEDLEYENGEIEFDSEETLLLFHDVDFSVYTMDDKQLIGHQRTMDAAFSAGVLKRTTSSTGGEYLVYDQLVTFKKHPEVWLRGAISLSAVQESAGTLRRMALLTLPALIAIAALGGYLLASRALKPIGTMTRIAHGIAGGEDLGRRIPLPPAQDELAELADTFNGMLERLGQSFAKERQLIADVAHELRTPLTVIATQSEYAMLENTPMADKNVAFQIIHETGERMSSHVARLLQLARMDTGKQPVNIETLCLSDLLEGILQELREAAQAKGMALRGELPPGVSMQGDQMLLASLYINLVSNAIAYGRTGGQAVVRLEAREDRIVSIVEDDGMGIAPEHLPRIWDRYYRVDPSRTGEEGHTGLGLSIVRWIVAQHGGEIHVESTLGVGTTFIVSFPKT